MGLDKLASGSIIKRKGGVTQFFGVDEIEGGSGLPQDLIDAFEKTGRAQRSEPESKMVEAQKYFGGGVLTNVLEHLGDCTHRITHHVRFGSVYPDILQEKVSLGIRRLSRGEGFVSEHKENLTNNAEYKGVPEKEMKEKFDAMLVEYAKLHEKVPVYNRIQWYAREAAINLGYQKFDESLNCLNVLEQELQNENTFVMRATMVNRNEDGEIVEFKRSDLNPSLEMESNVENNHQSLLQA